MFRSLRRLKGPSSAEFLELGLLVAGVTGAALALFMGKLFAAVVLAVVCAGIFLRFKRGRVRKTGER